MDSLQINLTHLDLSPVKMDKINSYIGYLLKFDKSKRLVSIKNKDWGIKHIEDCILAFKLMEQAPCFVDMGSGNGLPGVIFSILDENQPMCLVDNDRKKGEFLKTMVHRLNLRAKVLIQSVEVFDLNKVPRGTVFLYRAFSPKKRAIDFISRNKDFDHIFFANEGQELSIQPKKTKKYNLSNGNSKRILFF